MESRSKDWARAYSRPPLPMMRMFVGVVVVLLLVMRPALLLPCCLILAVGRDEEEEGDDVQPWTTRRTWERRHRERRRSRERGRLGGGIMMEVVGTYLRQTARGGVFIFGCRRRGS